MTAPPWQPMPPPQPRGGSTLRTVLIVVGIVLVLCCGGAVVGGVFLFRGVQQATGPVQDTADGFITDLEEGDTTAAYNVLCAGTRSAFSADTFAQGVAGQPKIRSHDIDGVNVRNMNGHTSATVTARLTLDTGFVDEHTFAMVKEDGAWKVCGRPY